MTLNNRSMINWSNSKQIDRNSQTAQFIISQLWKAVAKIMKELDQIYKLQSSEELFRSSIKLLIFLCQLFGVAPLPVLFGQHERLEAVRWKVFRCFHRIWCGWLIICITTSFYFQHVKFNTIVQYSQIKILLHIGEYVSIISTCTACVIGSQINRNAYNKYFQAIIEIDSKLNECGCRTNFTNLKRFTIKCVAACFLFEFVMVSVFALSLFGEDNSIVRNITLYVIPHIMVLLAIIKYCTLLYAIQERYRSISLLLKKISVDLLFKKEYRQTKTVLQTAITENKICQKLNSLRLAFLDIATLTTDVNESFGVLIVSILVSTFLILSTEFFAFYEFIERSAPDLYEPVLSFLWIIFYGGRISFVLRMNHAVNIEVRKQNCSLWLCLFLRVSWNVEMQIRMYPLRNRFFWIRSRRQCGVMCKNWN